MNAGEEYADGLQALAPEFRELTELLSADPGSQMDPRRVVDVAVNAVPHATSCAITLTVGSGPPRTIAATDEVPVAVDAIQYATRQGPCLEALDKDDLVEVEDLSQDDRWPAFAARCVAETPVRSMLGVRLRLDGSDRAAMNFYADQPRRFEKLDLGVASLLAPFVTLSVQSALNQEKVSQLQTALETSRQIGTAMGIVMARELVTSEEAFELLRKASQHLNRKLRDVAAEVEFTGTLPDMGSGDGRVEGRRARGGFGQGGAAV